MGGRRPSNKPCRRGQHACLPIDQGPAREEHSDSFPQQVRSLSLVEAVFLEGLKDYHKYVEFTIMGGSAQAAALVTEEVSKLQWEKRTSVSVDLFDCFSPSDLVRASKALSVNLVFGTLGRDCVFKIVFDPRLVLWNERYSTRFICVCENESGVIMSSGERVKNIQYYDSTFSLLPTLSLCGHKDVYQELPRNRKLARAVAARYFSNIHVYAQVKTREFKKSKFKSNWATSLFEICCGKGPKEGGEMHILLQIKQETISSQPIVQALMLDAPPKLHDLSEKAKAGVDRTIAAMKRKAEATSAEEPELKKSRNNLIHRKLNFCCTSKACGFCTEVVPEIEKARGLKHDSQATSPMFNPFQVYKKLELTHRVRTTGLDTIFPNLLRKLDRVRALSIVSWDIESLSHCEESDLKPGVEELRIGQAKRSFRCGVQTPYLFGASTICPQKAGQDLRKEDLQFCSFEVKAKTGLPSRGDVASMVDNFVDWLFGLAGERASKKLEILQHEMSELEEFEAAVDSACQKRNPGDNKGHKMQSTFLGKLLPQLREAVSNMYVVGFNTSR